MRRLAYPVDRARWKVSSKFGWRTDPHTGERKRHLGVDVPLPVGTPVGAAAAGRVIKIWVMDDVNGNAVRIDHGDGVQTSYVHLDSLAVQVGDLVRQGELVGESGNTGKSTGPHLHFAAWVLRNGDWEAVDPMRLLGGTGGRLAAYLVATPAALVVAGLVAVSPVLGGLALAGATIARSPKLRLTNS